MASRQQEKERRRQERLARERAAAAAAARRRRLGILGGAVLAAAAVAAVAVALAAGGGGKTAPKTGGSAIADVAIPAARATDLEQAARAADCSLSTFPSEGRGHTTSEVTYRTNPPTSGAHNPTAASDGIYDPGQTPPKEQLVHALEHGRIEIQYRPGTPQRTIGQLQSLAGEIQEGGDPRVLLFQNDTGMRYAVAATAWTHLLGCDAMNERVFDAMRAFTKRYDLKAPEQVVGTE
jgi:Protein of unknown function (DUF3105)